MKQTFIILWKQDNCISKSGLLSVSKCHYYTEKNSVKSYGDVVYNELMIANLVVVSVSSNSELS